MRICPHCNRRTDEQFCPDDGTITVPEALLDAAAHDPLLGQVLNHAFRIEALIGKGGMGAVYRGVQISVQREVAIKVILQDFARDPNNIKRFHREAQATSKLHHPNIVYLHDFGQTEEGILYIAMEYLRGRTLEAEIEEGGAIPEARLVPIAAQILKALHHAHSQGIVHRDLKVANVFLVRGDQSEGDLVKVVDFGIAKILSSDTGQSDITKTGLTVGSPAYMSPEQAMNKGVDARSDLYSLGVILYEAITGHQPYEGETPLEVILKHIQEPPPVLPDNADLPHPISDSLRALVGMLLEKDKERRPASALDALHLLPGHADAEASGAVTRSAAYLDRVPTGPRPVPDPSTPGHPRGAALPGMRSATDDEMAAILDEAGVSRPGRRWMVLVLLLALGLGGALWWLWPHLTGQAATPGTPPPAATAEPAAAPATPAPRRTLEPTPAAVPAPVAAPAPEPAPTPAATPAAQPTPASASPRQVMSVITSTPEGAKVYLGEEPLGETPFTLRGLEGDVVELRVVRKGYKVKKVMVHVGEQETLSVTLEKRSTLPKAPVPKPAAPKPRPKVPEPDPAALDRIGVPAKDEPARPAIPRL